MINQRVTRPGIIVGFVLALALPLSAGAQSPTPPDVLPVSEAPPDWVAGAVPTATVQHDGLRFDITLASTAIEPGDWIQALARVTNASDSERWYGQFCSGEGLSIGSDLSALFAPGVNQVGLAARLKRELARSGAVPEWQMADGTAQASPSGVDCAPDSGAKAQKLEPGASVERTYAIRPTYILRRPLPPGPITVRATFEDWGGGSKPDRKAPPLMLAVMVINGGADQDYPSPFELIDQALADPTFGAFVAGAAGKGAWVNPSWHAWESLPSAQQRWAELPGRVPDGFVEIGLFRDADGDEQYAVANLDPWTGEVLSFGED